ncbi:MAG: hypothetical protein C3F13_17050 [Anaerolineales bacterium]|nr:zinc ribbon domain-containing protein [Anaerolineae bacterium]PWB50175.1 MAG: hypothetical protein C3F13_17050 [Anaerolineales bacterium]
MSKVLKWILYILLGLVCLAIVAGIILAFVGFGHGYNMMRPGFQMMQPYYYSHYYPGGGLFRGLLGLGFLVLVIVGVVALVNAIINSNRRSQALPPAQVPPATPEVPARTCANCGKPAQEDWHTCPYCGNPLT